MRGIGLRRARGSGCSRATSAPSASTVRPAGSATAARSDEFQGAEVVELRYSKRLCNGPASRAWRDAAAGRARTRRRRATSTPTTIPPQLIRGGRSSTSVSARNSDGSTCEHRPERHLPPSRVEQEPRSLADAELEPARGAVGRGHDLDAVLDVAGVDLLDAEEIRRRRSPARSARGRFRRSPRPRSAGPARGRPLRRCTRTPAP